MRGTVALGALQLAGRATGLAFLLVATRTLSPPDFGRYAIASALILGASTIADLGTTSVITKLVSREPERSDTILSAALVPSAALGVLSFVGLMAFVFVSGYGPVARIDVLLAGIGLPADAITTSLFGGFDGRGLIPRRAILSMVRVVAIAGGGLVALIVTGEVRPAIVALGAGPVVTLLVTAASARRSGLWRGRLLFDRQVMASLIVSAIPFAVLGGINVIILRADIVILSILRTPAEVARYDVALRAVEALTFLATVVAAPSLFILSRRIGVGDVPAAQRAYDGAIRSAYLMGLPLTAVVVTLADPLAQLAFGPEYRASAELLAILGLQLWLAFLASVQGSLLLAGGQLRRAVKLFATVAVVAVGVEVAAIGIAGATGAAMVMVILQLMVVASSAWFSSKVTGVKLPSPPVGAVTAAATSAAVMGTLSFIGLGWRLAAGALSYGLVLVITRTIDRHDLDDLLGHLRKASA